MSRDFTPARVSSPGKIIQREIEARGWTQQDLADIMGRPVQAINEIIKGSKQVTPETALQLAAAFGTTPQFWLNLETNYRLWIASKNEQAAGIEKRGKLYSILPIREIRKKGWLKPVSSGEELEDAVREFLGVEDPYTPILVNFRCSQGREPDMPSKLAWVKRVEQLALQRKTNSFEPEKLLSNLPDILRLSEREENLESIPGIMAEYGVRFVIVPHLPRTYIDGAAFYLKDFPVIALSLRYDRMDSFWFNLCHELSHILYDHGQSFLDVDPFGEDGQETVSSEEEQNANKRATDWLIDPEEYERFLHGLRKPFVSRQIVVDFAHAQQRHPGIIVGRLHREGHVPYKNLRELLPRVSPYLDRFIDY